MSTVFETTTREQLPEVRRFLLEGFGRTPASLFERPGYLEWKYYEERPDWRGARSFVLRQNGTIIAHCSICPIALVTPSGRLTAQHSIDWTSTVPAGGVMIWRSMYAQSDVFFGMNGSPATQRVLAGLKNFRKIGQQDYCLRVVRPLLFSWGRARTGGWREFLRAGRNLGRLFESWAPVPAGWQLTPVDKFGAEVDQLAQAASFQTFIAPERSAALLNYLLRCPIGQMRGWLLRDGAGKVLGWALVNLLGAEARIGDLWLNSEAPDDWAALVALVARTVAREAPGIGAVAMTAVAPFLKEAAARNNLRVVSSGPVSLHDPRQLLASGLPVNVQAVDGDQAYA